MDEFIGIITSPVDAVIIQTVASRLEAVSEERSQTLVGMSNSGMAFLEQAGASKVLAFLQTDCHRWSEESIVLLKETYYHVYRILIHLIHAGVAEYDLKESLVTDGVCDEVSRNVCRIMPAAASDNVSLFTFQIPLYMKNCLLQ